MVEAGCAVGVPVPQAKVYKIKWVHCDTHSAT